MWFRWLHKMPCNARKYFRVTKFLVAGMTVFCVSWIVCVNEWHGGVRWRGRRGRNDQTTMRTIVAYSEGKQAELDRSTLAYCDTLPNYPTFPEINRTWYPGVNHQSTWQQVQGTKVSVYAAYFDKRQPQRYIRILASFQGRDLSNLESLFCQTRPLDPFDSYLEVVVARPIEMWYKGWDKMSSEVETPLLLSCPITEAIDGPALVSVVTGPCNDPSNGLRIKSLRKIGNKRNFTICVKDMHFKKDISQDLIEWLETNKILGVDMIDMYIDKITVENEKVLLHYRDKGFVRLFHVPIKDKPKRFLWQRRRDHIITYNDCLYRNIIESEYVIPLDVDEIVLPKIGHTWPELIERLKQYYGWDPSKNSAISVQNVFFFDFMQGEHDYKEVPKIISKIYIKRDDVRIHKVNESVIEEIGLTKYDNSSSNEVIDNSDSNEDRELYNKYKMKCGRDLPVPKLERHVMRSAWISPMGIYSKSLMVTSKVLTAFNHYPLTDIRGGFFRAWSAPFSEVQLNHYKESCNTTVVGDCAWYIRRARIDRAALRLRRQLSNALADTICPTINVT